MWVNYVYLCGVGCDGGGFGVNRDGGGDGGSDGDGSGGGDKYLKIKIF